MTISWCKDIILLYVLKQILYRFLKTLHQQKNNVTGHIWFWLKFFNLGLFLISIVFYNVGLKETLEIENQCRLHIINWKSNWSQIWPVTQMRKNNWNIVKACW